MIELAVVVLCLLANALIAGAEMAFVAVSRPSLRELVRQGQKKAEVLLRLRERPERTLAVMQIGITLVGALAGAVGGAGAEEQLSPLFEKLGVSESTADTLAIGVVVIPLTYFTVVIGELIPKTLALRHSLAVGMAAAPWLSFFDRVLGPLVTIFEVHEALPGTPAFHGDTERAPGGGAGCDSRTRAALQPTPPVCDESRRP